MISAPGILPDARLMLWSNHLFPRPQNKIMKLRSKRYFKRKEADHIVHKIYMAEIKAFGEAAKADQEAERDICNQCGRRTEPEFICTRCELPVCEYCMAHGDGVTRIIEETICKNCLDY